MHQHVFNRKAAAWTGVVLMMVLMAAGCGETDGVEKYGVTIKIAAQRDPGQKVVAEMYRALIEKHTSLKAEVIPDFKSPELLRAFTDNEIQVATLYTARFPENSLMARSLDPARDALLEAQAASLGAPYYRWLKPLGFRNRYALFADGQTARKNGWQSISDLKTEAPRLNAAVEASWLEINSEGFNALCEQYGLAFHRVIPAQTRDVYSAIQNGQADVIVAETDDGRVRQKGLRLLRDDRSFFPDYFAVPVVKTDTWRRYPELAEVLNLLHDQLNDRDMARFEQQVEEQEQFVRDVAETFLIEKGLL